MRCVCAREWIFGAFLLVTAAGTTCCGGNGSAPLSNGDHDAATVDAMLPPRVGGSEDASAEVALDPSLDAALDEAETGPCELDVVMGGTCNSLSFAGPILTAMCSPVAAPTPHGGTIETGTYVLDSMILYGPCQVEHERATWEICGSSWETIQESDRVTGDPDAGTDLQHFGVTTTQYSRSITATVECSSAYADATPPATPTQVTWGYDATPGHLVLYIPMSPGVRADSFTMQR